MPSGTVAALSICVSVAITHTHSCDLVRSLNTRALASRVAPWVPRGGSGSRFESVIEPATRRGRTG